MEGKPITIKKKILGSRLRMSYLDRLILKIITVDKIKHNPKSKIAELEGQRKELLANSEVKNPEVENG